MRDGPQQQHMTADRPSHPEFRGTWVPDAILLSQGQGAKLGFMSVYVLRFTDQLLLTATLTAACA